MNRNFNVPSTRQLIKALVNLKKWKSNTPLQKWSHLYGVGTSLCYVLKVTPFTEDQTLCWYSYYPLVYISMHFTFVLYTITYYILNGELSKGLPCTCFFIGPICGTLPVLYITLSKRRFKLYRFLTFPGRYIYPDNVQDTDEKYYQVCSKHIDESIRSFFFKTAILATAATTAAMWPTYQSLSQEIKITALEMRFPYVDKNSYTEFWGNIFIECNIFGHGFLGYFSIEVGMVIISDFITLSPKLLKYRLQKLFIHHGKKPSAEVIAELKNIIQHLKQFDEFVHCLGDLFYWRSFFIPPLYTYSIGMGIFTQFMMGFSAGYGLSALQLVQMFYICELGEQVDDTGLSDAIYNTKWYVLPIKVQKDLSCLIHRNQNGLKMVFGPIDTINRVYFMLVIRKVYSFIMYLKKTQDRIHV